MTATLLIYVLLAFILAIQGFQMNSKSLTPTTRSELKMVLNANRFAGVLPPTGKAIA